MDKDKLLHGKRRSCRLSGSCQTRPEKQGQTQRRTRTEESGISNETPSVIREHFKPGAAVSRSALQPSRRAARARVGLLTVSVSFPRTSLSCCAKQQYFH